MRDSDESLLKSFAINRDEAAFRTLADRYLGFVFHTALRRTNNRPLAEEVSQNILCALANKSSSLAKNPELLPAWLHRATLFESSKAMRSESSHQRRKQLQPADATIIADSPWSDAIPHLDLALDKLSASDRGILLLHFFENRSFPKIAQALGKNPAAVQKQSQRALAKLARILRGRGVTLTATAIAAGLTTELVKAAPAALLQSATAAVLSGAATYSTTGLTLMFAAKSKAFIPLAVLLCAMPLTLQQAAISSVRDHHKALRTQLYLADNKLAKSTSRHSSTTAKGTNISSNLDILMLVDEQAEARRIGGLRQIGFLEKLAALTPEVLAKLIGEGAVLRIQQENKTGILKLLISALADKDARLAVTVAIGAFPAGPELSTLVSQTQIASLFSTWADADPASALVWFQEQERSGKLKPTSGSDSAGPLKAFKAPMIRALAGINNSQAILILNRVAESERLSTLSEVLGKGGLNHNPSVSSVALRLMPVLREIELDDEDGLETIGSSLANDFGGGLTEATLFLNEAELETHERETITRAIAETTLGTSRNPPDSKRDARIDAELVGWLQATVPQIADAVIVGARAKVAASRANQAEYIIKSLREAKDPTDLKLSEELMNYDFKSHMQDALDLAGKITKECKAKDPSAASTFAKEHNLSK